MNSPKKINLPCLRGKMGDWMYYVSLLKFQDVSDRVFLPEQIDKKYSDKEDLKLGDWIQRDIEKKRIKEVVDYLRKQEQRFFNSLILGIYDGKPSYRDIEVKTSEFYNNEDDVDYFSRTFGILTLNGDESIFAIDGQHRAVSIKNAIEKDENLKTDEICVIFLAHKNSDEGKTRTRRLFSTLNRYAKPVNKKEIIALSEDDNCAILTRKIVENYTKFQDKILITGNKSISSKNKSSFTTIIQLYDIIVLILCKKRIISVKTTDGEDPKEFLNTRTTDSKINKFYKTLENIFDRLCETFSQLKNLLLDDTLIDRNDKETSLIFRPIGQEIFFKVLKVGIDEDKEENVYTYFSKAKFNLKNPVWESVFWDQETETIITTSERQKYAYLLIMERIGFSIKRTKKDIEMYEAFKFSSNDI